MKVNIRNPLTMGLIGGGILLMLIAVVMDTAFKPPLVEDALAAGKKKITGYQLETEKNRKVAADTALQVNTKLWSDSDDVIAPKALSKVTTMAQSSGLKVTTFRPQKEIAAGTLTLLPMAVGVEGPFPALASFLKNFEDNEPLLVLEAVQATAADETTHNVTATITIDAYIDPNRPVTVGSTTKSKATPPVNKGANDKKTPSPELKSGPQPNSTVKKA